MLKCGHCTIINTDLTLYACRYLFNYKLTFKGKVSSLRLQKLVKKC